MLNETEEFICFAAVARTGSITAAAKLLTCSKAHVSRKLAALESRLGIRLLHRSTRHIHLTDAGTRMRVDAERLLDQVHNLHNQSRNLNIELSGKFVITAPVSMATYLLAPELDALKQAFPQIDFEIRSANRVVDLVREDVDLGIRTDSVVDDNLIARQLGFMQEVFVASDEFYSPDSVTDLADLNIQKLLVNPHYVRDGQLHFCCKDETSYLNVQGATLIQDNPISVEMLFQNDYIGWLPDYCRHVTRKEHQLVNLLPVYCGVQWPVFLVYPFQVPLPLKLQKVASFLQERLGARLLD